MPPEWTQTGKSHYHPQRGQMSVSPAQLSDCGSAPQDVSQDFWIFLYIYSDDTEKLIFGSASHAQKT